MKSVCCLCFSKDMQNVLLAKQENSEIYSGIEGAIQAEEKVKSAMSRIVEEKLNVICSPDQFLCVLAESYRGDNKDYYFISNFIDFDLSGPDVFTITEFLTLCATNKTIYPFVYLYMMILEMIKHDTLRIIDPEGINSNTEVH